MTARILTSEDRRLLLRGGLTLWRIWSLLLGAFLVGYIGSLSSQGWTDPFGWQGQLALVTAGSAVFAGLLAGASIFLPEKPWSPNTKLLSVLVAGALGSILLSGAVSVVLFALVGSPAVGQASVVFSALAATLGLLLLAEATFTLRASNRQRAELEVERRTIRR